MYRNIGGKIKGGAIALFILGALGTFITGIVFTTNYYTETIGILLIILGPIVSWLSSWALYGFGELISKTSEIAYYTKYIAENSAAPISGAAPVQRAAVPPPVAPPPANWQADALLKQGLISQEEYNMVSGQAAPQPAPFPQAASMPASQPVTPPPAAPIQQNAAPHHEATPYRRQRRDIHYAAENPSKNESLEDLLQRGLITQEEYDQLVNP